MLGGIGTLLGPLWGAIAFFALEELLQPVLNLVHTGWGEYWQMVFGPLLVLVADIIGVFGGATIVLHNDTFIKWKPTVLYWLFAVTLIGSSDDHE